MPDDDDLDHLTLWERAQLTHDITMRLYEKIMSHQKESRLATKGDTMPTDADDRLTILERAHRLHEAILRRHEAIVDRHDEQIGLLRNVLAQQTGLQASCVALLERLTQRQDQQEERLSQEQMLLAEWLDRHAMLMDHLAQTLDAIDAWLARGSGHDAPAT